MPVSHDELDYHMQDVFFATNRRVDDGLCAFLRRAARRVLRRIFFFFFNKAAQPEEQWVGFTTEAEEFLQYGKATVAIPKV